MLGLVALDPFLGSRLYVLQMPDGHVLEWWEEGVDLCGKEAIYFSFALELGGKLSSAYLGLLVKDLSLPSCSGYLVGIGIHRESKRFNVKCMGI